ncbi:C-C chemokine receptor type 4 [Bombina bombina]|uniref:C-C chemokine receptor type 4 n=1 Tax=Bombina bombina TaxID=8345 RepID=UPI00235B2D5B|nr:C-C chemokine receptor type 4 [Bombina bombina]XP_053569036.1 C-C chemokine receptor type 4 [Bombina bombina]
MESTTENPYYDYSDMYDAIPIQICEREELRHFVSTYITPSYYLMFILSFIGNGLITLILVKWEKFHSVTNIFILNLVISNIFFSSTLPFMAVYQSSAWIFGNIMCKMTNTFFFIGFQSFAAFLTLMTIDQYLIVVHSWSSSSRGRISYALYMSIIVWSVSIFSSIPDIILYTESDQMGNKVCEVNNTTDNHWWLLLAHYKHFVLFFLVPLFIIITCYFRIVLKLTTCNIRRKTTVLKLIFSIVILFILCWTPYNIIMFVMFQKQTFIECHSFLPYIFSVCQSIVYFHCCLNPVLYAFLGTKFRKYLCSCAKNCLPRTPQQNDLSLRTSLGL